MEIDINKYISEEEKKEIAIDIFRDKIKEAFGGNEYSDSGKERDRVIKNAVAKWITEYIENLLTEDDKRLIQSNVTESIQKENYSFYIFQKPDIWDRSEYTAYKIITQSVKDNEDFIKEKVTREIQKKFTLD